jgi:hypothetical protein
MDNLQPTSRPAPTQDEARQMTDPKFSDPAATAGRSRIWIPILAVMFFFLITAAAVMLISSLVYDAESPTSPAAPDAADPPAITDPLQ